VATRESIWHKPAELHLPPGFAAVGEDVHYALQPRALLPGNRIVPLRAGGETYPDMLAAIHVAEATIHFEIYILRSDHTGRSFAAALIERARAGVRVRLMYDAVGSLGLAGDFLHGLREAGVEIVEYHPVAPWRARFSVNYRDHRKIMIVDGRVAFTGGLNIGDEYASLADGGGGWHDMHARVEGPAVAMLEHLFRRNWINAGGPPYAAHEIDAEESVATPGTALAIVLGTDELKRRSSIRRAYVHAMKHARQTISIMNAYFIPDRGVRRALRNAVARGVQVKVVVPRRSDLRSVSYASQHLFAGLLKAGVRIFRWPERMMHAKTAVIDGVWTKIGSYNLDARSLHYNLEVVVAAIDRPLGARMQTIFDEDVARCEEVVLDKWQQRGFWRKLISWFFYQFRHWL
jgi:cardiolipin synthase